MVVRILFLIGQFILALVKLIPAGKPEPPKDAPSTVPPVDEPGRALDRARARARKPSLPN